MTELFVCDVMCEEPGLVARSPTLRHVDVLTDLGSVCSKCGIP